MNDNIKMIRFIDSDYKDLFCIPSGANIKITYPPGDSRGTVFRQCKYIDEHHARIGNNDYHIAQFAERMEALGAKYEPEFQLQNAELVSFAPGEEKFLTFYREEGNTCIGLMDGDFGSRGNRFSHHWSYRDNTRNKPEFQEELHGAVYLLRRDVLKDYAAMKEYCHSHPEAKLPGRNDLERYGFRLDTETRQYFLLCTLAYQGSFILYAYDKAAQLILPEATENKMFYRDDDNKQGVGYLRGDFGRSGDDFYHSWSDAGNGRNTMEFKNEFQDVMTLLRNDILKDHKSCVEYCSRHPEAKLPDGDGRRYGFKLETDARQYFVRCTTLKDDYFYVFIVDKAAPVLEQEQPAAEKPSVLDQLREAKKTPPAPSKAKESRGKDGLEI